MASFSLHVCSQLTQSPVLRSTRVYVRRTESLHRKMLIRMHGHSCSGQLPSCGAVGKVSGVIGILLEIGPSY